MKKLILAISGVFGLVLLGTTSTLAAPVPAFTTITENVLSDNVNVGQTVMFIITVTNTGEKDDPIYLNSPLPEDNIVGSWLLSQTGFTNGCSIQPDYYNRPTLACSGLLPGVRLNEAQNQVLPGKATVLLFGTARTCGNVRNVSTLVLTNYILKIAEAAVKVNCPVSPTVVPTNTPYVVTATPTNTPVVLVVTATPTATPSISPTVRPIAPLPPNTGSGTEQFSNDNITEVTGFIILVVFLSICIWVVLLTLNR